MKRITKKNTFFTTLLLSVSFLSFAQTTVDFSYTGSPQEWIVPCGVTEIQVDAYGASGTTSIPGYMGNEHIITGEEGDYLFIEETYYNVDGTIFDSRYFVYLQP